MSIRVVVVTGGPCAGKTTALEAVKKEFGEKVLIAPEPATMLMSTGFPAPGRDLVYSQAWQQHFQKAVGALHLNMEETFKIVAEQNRAQLIICDRGILDGAAYVPGGLRVFLEAYGLDLAETYARYDQVIHLESTATCNPDLYGKAGNQTRYESLAEAKALELRTRDVWRDHPNWSFIPGANGIDSVVSQVLSAVSKYVDIEIERKFWLPEFPQQFRDVKVLPIEQGYLVSDEGEMRIRLIGNETYIGAKGPGTIQREEWEKQFPRHFFDFFWAQTDAARVSKDRYYISYNSHVLEVDVYSGLLEGLVTMECEFHSLDEAEAFILPDWAVDAIDVTTDPAFKNKNLALHGLPSNFG